jgi:uncharacterized membrane protein YgdD (TMEM256/DUF423 family)
MNDVFFTIGCCSMFISIITATIGAHGGLSLEQQGKWDKAVKFQQFGAIPLLLATRKATTWPGCLALAGAGLFCIPLYYTTLTGDITFNKVMPYGGMLMMASWLALGFLN